MFIFSKMEFVLIFVLISCDGIPPRHLHILPSAYKLLLDKIIFFEHIGQINLFCKISLFIKKIIIYSFVNVSLLYNKEFSRFWLLSSIYIF